MRQWIRQISEIQSGNVNENGPDRGTPDRFNENNLRLVNRRRNDNYELSCLPRLQKRRMLLQQRHERLQERPRGSFYMNNDNFISLPNIQRTNSVLRKNYNPLPTNRDSVNQDDILISSDDYENEFTANMQPSNRGNFRQPRMNSRIRNQGQQTVLAPRNVSIRNYIVQASTSESHKLETPTEIKDVKHNTTQSSHAVITSSNVPLNMELDAIYVVGKAVSRFKDRKEIAAYVARNFDIKHGRHWNCFVTPSFGGSVHKNSNYYVHLKVSQIHVILFKPD